MTKAQTKKAIQALSPYLTAKYTPEYSEWRVAVSLDYFMATGTDSYNHAKTHNENSAYYTNDAQDALGTAERMVREYNLNWADNAQAKKA